MNTIDHPKCNVLHMIQKEESIGTGLKVRKKANIRNRYNQVPNLTRDAVWESDKDIHSTYLGNGETYCFAPFFLLLLLSTKILSV